MREKPYHHKHLRKELIKKGIEMVSAHGIQSFSLRKAADACGVSHMAPYSHFKNKDGFLQAMRQHITDEFAAVLERTMQRYASDPQILLQLGKTYITFFLDNPAYFTFLFGPSNIKVDLSVDSCDEGNFKPYVIFRNLVFSLLDPCACKEEKNDFAIALWAIVHGIVSIATMENVVYEEKWEDKIGDFLQAFSKNRKQ